MIKDKITQELRSRFIEDIKISKESGKERGFFICQNKDEKLIPSKSCEGSECSIHLGDPRTACPSETTTYGNFHTHPYLYNIKQEFRKDGKIPPNEELKITNELKTKMMKNIGEFHERITGVKGININSPSYTDVLKALLAKSINFTKGTVCTSTDIDTNKIECWTIKDIEKDKLTRLAVKGMIELDKTKSEGSGLIKKWLDDISERETIELYPRE